MGTWYTGVLMTYYRIGSIDMRFGTKIFKHDTIQNIGHSNPKAIEKLIKLGRISVVKGPPLRLLDELNITTKTIEKLEKLGVVNAEDLLNIKYDAVKTIWRKQENFERVKTELIENHLLIPIKNRDCNC